MSGCLQFILGIISVVSTIGFFAVSFSPQVVYPTYPVKVGQIYASYNPGVSHDPKSEPEPFVTVYKVEEINGDSVRVSRLFIHPNQMNMSPDYWQSWESTYEFGKFWELLN